MNNNMTKLIRVTVAVALLVLAVGTLTVSARDSKDFTVGKKGDVHFNVPVKAGNTVLKPGMYQIQHFVEGADHFVAFKEMQMPAGYRHGNTPVADESSARIKCNVEPVDQKVRHTTIKLRINAAGEKEIAEVQFAGEAFKHLF
jgi:hypothetical protein